MTWTFGSRLARSTHSASSRAISKVIPFPRSGRFKVMRAIGPVTSYVIVDGMSGSSFRWAAAGAEGGGEIGLGDAGRDLDEDLLIEGEDLDDLALHLIEVLDAEVFGQSILDEREPERIEVVRHVEREGGLDHLAAIRVGVGGAREIARQRIGEPLVV